MKVAYFAGSLVKNLDGVSRVLYKIAEYNRANEIESVFVSPDVDERIGHPSISLKGIRLPFYKEYKLSTSWISFIEKKLEELNFVPDLIHVHSPCTAGLAGVKLARKLGIPVIATYHTHFVSYLQYHKAELLQPFVERYMRYFYNQCDVVIVPSFTLQKELQGFGINSTQVIPHGVDYTLFNKDHFSKLLKLSEGDKKILLYTGRLVWEKNLGVLIEAIAQLSKKRNDFVLWVVGTGNAEKALKTKLPNSKFLGFCDGKKLSQVYATADVFLFPSETETFGNVTLEAMASATCCIVANARGSADLIRHGENGLLFGSKDVLTLTNLIEEMLDNPEKRSFLAQQGYATSKSYRWKDSLQRQVDIYLEVVNKKNVQELNYSLA